MLIIGNYWQESGCRPEASGIISTLIHSISTKEFNTYINKSKIQKKNRPVCHFIVSGLLYLALNKDKATS